MSSQKCIVPNCNTPAHIGKSHCLEHYKQQDNFEYGLDAEIQRKLDAKLDPRKMAQAQAWIEALIGEQFPGDFQESLKSGVRLCKAVNAIKPGIVRHINMMNSPFKHRENIVAYLTACGELGVKEVDRFVTQDLYEGDNLVSVIDNIFALGAASMKVPSFKGPYLGVKHAEENVRQFSDDVLAKSKSTPSRQTVGSYGFQDETKNPSLSRQIVKNVTGMQASETPSKLSQGSYGISDGKGLSGIDSIIKNPEVFAANRGGAQPSAPSGSSSSGGGGFCGNCGTARVGAAKFCGNCGNAF